MKFKKHESGRSMVEMLGVLAVIGVLSVGGIAGYSLSMRRHRANQVVDLMSKYALVSYAECQKKFLEGALRGRNYCYQETRPFVNADIGSLPAGVIDIATDDIILNTESGFDEIETYALFSDIKLCQAVGAVVGTECIGNMVGYTFTQK